MSSLAHERRRAPGDDGFTIIEVMIAMLILIVGVLGTFTLLEGSMSSTARTTAREQGTNLARDIIERTRQLDYANTTMALAPAKLRLALPGSDSVTALTGTGLDTFDVTRRGTTYTVKVSACSIDDPTDGVSVGDSTYCPNSSGPSGPGTPTPGPAPAQNVLGVDVGVIYLNAGGSVLTTVCNALSGSLLTQVTSVLSTVVPVSACPAGTGNTSVAVDGHPDDLRRVRVDVTWNRGGPASLSQTTLLTNPRQN
jgi:Tfp pilus assembly protein PilV